MKESRIAHVLRKRKMLLVSIWLIFVYWTLESLIHVFVFNQGGFERQFLFPDPHEIWMRLIVILMLLTFGFYADFMVGIHRKAEERIRYAHSELNQIFNTAADGMRLIDKNFNILKVNDTFSKMVRIARDDAVNKKCYEVFRGSLCHTPSCPLRRILNGEEYVEVDSEKKRNDGSLKSRDHFNDLLKFLAYLNGPVISISNSDKKADSFKTEKEDYTQVSKIPKNTSLYQSSDLHV